MLKQSQCWGFPTPCYIMSLKYDKFLRTVLTQACFWYIIHMTVRINYISYCSVYKRIQIQFAFYNVTLLTYARFSLILGTGVLQSPKNCGLPELSWIFPPKPWGLLQIFFMLSGVTLNSQQIGLKNKQLIPVKGCQAMQDMYYHLFSVVGGHIFWLPSIYSERKRTRSGPHIPYYNRFLQNCKE